jgi:hypothetical protein
MSDRRVLRGETRTFQYDGALHLVVDDGDFNNAWRITKFAVSPVDITSSSVGSRDCAAVLATHEDAVQRGGFGVIEWRWNDRRQVAWTSIELNGDTTVGAWSFGLIDPQHVVVRDLYFGLSAASATGTTEFNYFIELERVKLNDNQAVMALVQEVAQDVN